MDREFKFPPSPGAVLHPISPERVNQQRQSLYEGSPASSIHGAHSRDSSVHEKIAAFNNFAQPLAFQSKQLERKTNDAALKRAMLGREEAESEMRKHREDNKVLRRQLDEETAKEKKICYKYETLMEEHHKLKEFHGHTKTKYEKEIRRLRNDTLKRESVFIKQQEELKFSRETSRKASDTLQEEKARSSKREQEAFEARYQLVGVQEELEKAQTQIKILEQERDALRMIAKNEEIARIAAEGQIPLPPSQEDDEFSSPKKARKSLGSVMITSSAASEEELDDMRMLLEWEQQRANRAHDRVEFLEAECRLNCCASRALRSTSAPLATQEIQIGRKSTVFIPAEGIFRTVSPAPEESPWISPAKKSNPPVFPQQSYQATPSQARQQTYSSASQDLPSHARTPSCEPPAPALISSANTSLLSLLDAPHSPTHTATSSHDAHDTEAEAEAEAEIDDNPTPTQARIIHHANPTLPSPSKPIDESPAPTPTPYTFHTISHTTRIPLAIPDLTPTPPSALPANLALSPTMSRDEALRQIQERRGRARSLAQGTLTPRKQMGDGGLSGRRDISAPAVRSGNVRGRMASRV